ncbi:hypothetical protein [Cognatishimia sp. MH4019]|uniref:DUF7424 family protein n=1 Tax=Cognatishimia sp. MH4019 TaxID=2854030 RepID=UPI001CD7BFB6|nr:hypothetical protein [Cognatishimia sp. MH4019]
MEADLFTSDLLKVYETGEALTTPMVLAFEISSASQCEASIEGLTPALTAAYGQAESLGCDKRGFSDVANFRVPAEVVHEIANQSSDSDQPIYIGVYSDDPGLIVVGIFQNGDGIRAFEAAIPEELTQFARNEIRPLLSASLQNDLPDAMKLRLSSVFANGSAIPVLASEDFDLERRGQVDIVLSDVSNASLSEGFSHALIGTIVMP